MAEFRATLSRCLDCGAPLMPGERPETLELATEYVELVTVFVAADFSQGYVLASVLESAGIPVFLKGEHLVGAVGELPATVSQLEVQVPLEREAEAREIASVWERPTGRESRDSGFEADAGDPVHGAVAETLAREADSDPD